jgi:hypothetical protein
LSCHYPPQRVVTLCLRERVGRSNSGKMTTLESCMQNLLHRTPDYLDLKRNCRPKGTQQSRQGASTRGQSHLRKRRLPQQQLNQMNGRGGLRSGSQCRSLNMTSAGCRFRSRRACLRSEVWNSGTVTKLPAAQIRLQAAGSISALSLQSWHSEMSRRVIAIIASSCIDAAAIGIGIIEPAAKTVNAKRKSARR